jgi:hypothetical protein
MRRGLVICFVLVLPALMAGLCLASRGAFVPGLVGLPGSEWIPLISAGVSALGLFTGIIISQIALPRDIRDNSVDFGATSRGRANWATWLKWSGGLIALTSTVLAGTAFLLQPHFAAGHGEILSGLTFYGLVLTGLGVIYVCGGATLERVEWTCSPTI